MGRGIALIEDLTLVGAGGALGAMARFGVAAACARYSGFPWATLSVNVVGCLAIGYLLAGVEARGAHGGRAHLLLGVGLLGGLTTFSAFGYETLRMLRDGAWLIALCNVLANVVLGLLAAGAGWALGRTPGVA